MKQIERYHLHQFGNDKLHFETNIAKDYLAKNVKHSFTPHRHSFYQLIWFKEAGQHYIDYTTYKHPKNSIFFIDKGQIHYFCKHSENDGYLFHFNDQFLNRYEFNNENWTHYRLFHELSSPYLELSGELLDESENIKDQILKEFTQKRFGFEQQVYFLFRILLLNLERVKQEQHHELIDTRGEFNEVARFHQLVDQNIYEMHPIDFYASELGMSSRKLTNLVSKYLGDTPGNIINKRKTAEAKRLLSNTSLSIKEVGYKLGFNQATYFTKFFKKHSNYAPKEFKRLLEEGAFIDRGSHGQDS